MKFKLYSALGLNKNSNPSQDEIKKAYKKMAMEYHPDKNKDNPNAEEKFKEISNAYAVLSDDSKKRVYDQVGDDGYNEGDNIIVYDRKNKRVYIRYSIIYSFLEEGFELNFDELLRLVHNWLFGVYNIKPVTTQILVIKYLIEIK